MKKTLFLIVFCSGVLFLACSKNSDNIAGKHSLTGKWELVEVLKDLDTDYIGKWQTADTTEHLYLTFKTDSSIESNVRWGVNNLAKYRLVNDSVIAFKFNNVEQAKYYQLNDSNLIIKGWCYLACGWKFVRSEER